MRDRKLKITFLSPPPNLSGGERVIALYACELQRLGHEVEVVCYSPGRSSMFSRFKSLIRGGEWPTRQSPKSSHYHYYRIPFRSLTSTAAITDSDVADGDIVIATFWKTAEWCRQLCKSKGRQLYLVQGDEGTLHGVQAEQTYALPMQHIYVSNWIEERIRGRHPNATGCVIPNAIDAEFVNKNSRTRPSKFRVGTMWGGLGLKASDIAIEAVKQARATGLDVELVAFGSCRPDREFKSHMDQFRYCPSQDEVRQLYSSCNVWLFTSDFEGFGLPVLEAMALGTPVIGTNTGAAPELIPNGGGWLVPIGDAAGIASAILQCSRLSDSDWQQRSHRAQEVASAWTWPDAARRLVDIFLDPPL